MQRGWGSGASAAATASAPRVLCAQCPGNAALRCGHVLPWRARRAAAFRPCAQQQQQQQQQGGTGLQSRRSSHTAGGSGVFVVTELSPTKAPSIFRLGASSSGSDSSQPASTAPLSESQAAAPAPGPLAALRSLYLPEGFPATVTPDYLPYQLVSVPCHVTGWLSHSLATSSLLKAVGIDAGAVGAVAASAAIKWIVKDGIGAAGRFLVGGRLGREFDDDPRRWRMVAEAITTLGLALEISTTLYPQHFLALASTGNFAKALAKGMGKPVFRVVQTHFAATGNVGAVAAKEEVWEVSAQLAGYAASVALLQSLDGAGSWTSIVGLWALVQGVHVALRYAALSQLRFATLNQKRAAALAAAHVSAIADGARNGAGGGSGPTVVSLPGVEEVNAAEPMLVPATSVRPCMHLGCTLEAALGATVLGSSSSSSSSSSSQVGGLDAAQWAALYDQDPYLLAHHEGASWVVVKQGTAPRELLQAVWQAAWLDSRLGPTGAAGMEALAESAAAARQHFPSFLASMEAAGWDLTVQPVLQMQQTRVTVAAAADDGA